MARKYGTTAPTTPRAALGPGAIRLVANGLRQFGLSFFAAFPERGFREYGLGTLRGAVRDSPPPIGTPLSKSARMPSTTPTTPAIWRTLGEATRWALRKPNKFNTSTTIATRLVLHCQKPQWLSDTAINVNGTTIPLSWSQPLNWLGGVPNGRGAEVNFWRTLTADRTITLDGSKTLGTLLVR